MRIQLHSNFDQHTFFQAKVLISSLRLEPAVFIFYICYGIFFVTNQQLYIEKACKVWCPSSPDTLQENHHQPHHQHHHCDWQGQPWPQRQCVRQPRRVPRNSNEVTEADRSGAGDEQSLQACPMAMHIAHILTLPIFVFSFFFPKSWTMVKGLNGALQSLPTIVVAFFAGPISDRSPVPWCQSLTSHDHLLQSDRFSRKPLILVSLGGYLLLNIIYAVNAFWFYELKVFRPRPPNLSQQI